MVRTLQLIYWLSNLISYNYPLYVQELGMSAATAVNYIFYFTVMMSLPRMIKAFNISGVLGFYSALNFLGIFLVLLRVVRPKPTPAICSMH